MITYSNYAGAGKSSGSRDEVKKVLNFVYSSAAQGELIEVQTPESLQLAWGAALVLVAIILLLNIVTRLIGARARPTEGP